MSKYHELFSYQFLGGMAWASVVIDVETGIPYTAAFQQMSMGGAYYDQMQLGTEITYEQIYTLAIRKQENDFCSWFDPEKYKGINASNWKEFI